MSDAAPDEARVPAFRRGVRLRHDAVRDAWVLLAPERMFVPDEAAVAVLQLLDGARSLGGIADALCARYAAPRAVVLADVADMLAALADKGVLTW